MPAGILVVLAAERRELTRGATVLVPVDTLKRRGGRPAASGEEPRDCSLGRIDREEEPIEPGAQVARRGEEGWEGRRRLPSRPIESLGPPFFGSFTSLLAVFRT